MSAALGVGIAVRPGEGTPEWLRALDWATRADARGLHSLWVPEGHFQRGSLASPLLFLAACAARTRRLRLGTTSLLLPIHPPRRLAAEIACLDALSQGRVELGLGRGFRSPLFRGFGVAPETKRDRFDATLDALLAAWDGDDPALHPQQRPHPPLRVAAFGPKGLRQAAARGLAYLASPLETLPTLVENWRLWREHAGIEPPVVPVMRSVFVAESDAQAKRVRDALATELERLGDARGAAVPRALARAAGGALDDRVLVGNAQQVLDQLARYREALGLDLLVVRAEAPGVPVEACHDALDRLLTEVLPRLRDAPEAVVS